MQELKNLRAEVTALVLEFETLREQLIDYKFDESLCHESFELADEAKLLLIKHAVTLSLEEARGKSTSR